MIALKDFQSTTYKSKPRTSVGSMTGGEAMPCNRLLTRHYAYTPYYIKSEETTTFSINEPLLLTGFTCSPVSRYINNASNGYTNMLPTQITIAQVPNVTPSAEKEENIFYTGKIDIKCGSTVVKLSKSILVKPGFKYEIRMKLNPPENSCTGGVMKSEMEIGPDVVIQFHNDPTLEDVGTQRGLIHVLRFNRI